MQNQNTMPLQGSTIHFKYFFIVLTLFSATWLISDIAAIKLISIFGITLTGGFVIFPLTTMLNSLIVEVYGYKNARQAIWAGFIINLLFVLFINLVNLIPASPYWTHQQEFNDILVPSTRVIIASLISFFISDFYNSYFMAKMKIKSRGKSLIKRIFISYALSMIIDISIFMVLAFAGALSTLLLIKLMTAAYVKKILFQIALLPLTWYLIDLLKKKEGVEIFDQDTKFTPFSMDNVYQLSAYIKPKQNLAIGKPIISYLEK